MRFLNRSIIIVTPKQPFVDWINALKLSANTYSTDLYKNDGGVYMVSDISNHQEFIKIVESNYRMFFERELNGIIQDRNCWPKEICVELFYDWFELHYHTVVIDISEEPLQYEEDW